MEIYRRILLIGVSFTYFFFTPVYSSTVLVVMVVEPLVVSADCTYVAVVVYTLTALQLQNPSAIPVASDSPISRALSDGDNDFFIFVIMFYIVKHDVEIADAA